MSYSCTRYASATLSDRRTTSKRTRLLRNVEMTCLKADTWQRLLRMDHKAAV